MKNFKIQLGTGKLKFLILIVFLTFNHVVAQSTGKVVGKVIDGDLSEPLIGANVLIYGTSIGSATDLDGKYYIDKIPEGKYNVVFSSLGFAKQIVTGVEVKSDGVTRIDIILKPESLETDEVVVTAEALKSTEGSILNIQKNSMNIIDGLSAELISKNNSSDGTDVMKRMTGVTISEGKYVYVRGVGDRYNNTLLNGANLPSTDPEKKSFSYDLFPASLIENVLTSKTFTPDKPANFSGGLVEINTIEFPEKFILNVDASTSFNNTTNLKSFNTYNGGNSDWLGNDDGTREMPVSIGKEKVSRGNYSSEQLQSIGQGFKNNWKTKSKNAPLNSSFKINIGNNYSFSQNDLIGYIASVNYSNSYNSQQIEKNNYTFEGPRYLYNGSNSNHSVTLGALLNVSYKFAQKHKISIKNVFNQNSDDETTYYEGDYFYNPDYRKVTSMRYVSRSLYSSQLIGEHHLNFLNGLDIDWNFNYANSERNEPDARRYVYLRSYEDPSEPFRFQLDQSVATRFYGNLDDTNYGSGIDFTIRPFEDTHLPRFKFGFHLDKKDRTFDARTFGFKNIPGGNYFAEDSILQQSVDNIFTPENYSNKFIEVIEITKPSDSYKSDQNITAVYWMTDFDLYKFKIIGGIRNEISTQELNSQSSTGELVNIDRQYNDWLPSVNVTYPLNSKMNFRFAFTKTLARPEFREMAPYSYFDFLSAELVQGNTNLKRSKISNYDLRLELFPAPQELIAAGFFYKEFKDPIEQILIAASGFEPIRSFENAKSATNYGLELEIRKKMDFLYRDLENFSFVGNVSFISSEIKLNGNGFQVEKRPLQGQADFILNLGLYYDDYFNGFNASLIYNKVGEKISKVGFANLGDVIEKPRDQIDFSVSKVLFEYINIKFSIKDILAQDYKFIQRTLEGDKVFEQTKMGSIWSLGVGLKF